MTASCVQSSRSGHLWGPGVAAALDRCVRILAANVSPGVARRMSEALGEILQWTLSSKWPEVACSFSRLTGDGFPLLFSLSSLDATVRYVAEVAGPEAAEVDRLPRVLELINQLGDPSPAANISSLLFQVQAGRPLSYGAWIAGRHGQFGDSFKVYVE